jgi:hypothetical protein
MCTVSRKMTSETAVQQRLSVPGLGGQRCHQSSTDPIEDAGLKSDPNQTECHKAEERLRKLS